MMAAPLLTECVEARTSVQGRKHPDTIAYLKGDFSRAETLFLECLEASREGLGDKHPESLSSLNHLASFYKSQGEYAKAEPLFQEALAVGRRGSVRKQCSCHADFPRQPSNLASLYMSQHKHAKRRSHCWCGAQMRKQRSWERSTLTQWRRRGS